MVLCTTGDSTCPVRRRSVFPRALGVGGGPDLELHHVVAAYEAAAAEGADVIHDHTLAGPVYAEHFAPAPVVVTAHGPFDERLGAVYRKFAERLPLVAISHHQAATAGTAPIAAVIHHGVEPGQFPVGPGDGGYALFLGRMIAEKGVDRAIRVARRAGVPPIVAAKLSESHEYDYFETRVRPLLGPGVDFIGDSSTPPARRSRPRRRIPVRPTRRGTGGNTPEAGDARPPYISIVRGAGNRFMSA